MMRASELLACLASAGCAQLIGADDLDYTLSNDGGVLPPPGIFDDCTGRAGPVPVNVEGKFCIDSTEVTIGQYLEFLDAEPVIEQPAACAWNVAADLTLAFEPAYDWPPEDARADYPVTAIDWCDAWSYCHWAGKRLCGRVDGGAADDLDFDTTRSEYYYACSHAGELAYPYGDTYVPETCALTEIQPVRASAGCEGGYPGIYDISGNASEWVSICADITGADDYCRVGPAGASSLELPPAERSCAQDFAHRRSSFHESVGFRCCSDVR